ADHLACAHLRCLDADRWPALLISNALVKDLPDQPTEPVGNSADRLSMAEARAQPAVHDVEDRPLRLHRGIGGLVEDASHLPIAFRAAVTVVYAGTLLVSGAGSHT